MDRKEVVDQLEELHHKTRDVCIRLLNNPDGLDEVVNQLSKAATALRHAHDLMQHPGAKLVDVILADFNGTDSLYHATQANNHPLVTLCGYRPPMSARIIPDTRVPTCPECLKLLGVEG